MRGANRLKETVSLQTFMVRNFPLAFFIYASDDMRLSRCGEIVGKTQRVARSVSCQTVIFYTSQLGVVFSFAREDSSLSSLFGLFSLMVSPGHANHTERSYYLFNGTCF